MAVLLCLAVVSTVVVPAAALRPPESRADAARPAQASDLELTPEAVEFGRVRVGGPSTDRIPRLLTVTNAGDAPVAIEETTVAGPDAAAFETLRGGGPGTLEPGESRVIAVAFAPASAGTATATLRVETDDGDAVAADLRGTGLAPDVEVRPETLRFENATDGPVTETLTLTNEGNAPLTVRAVSVVGPDRTAFEVADAGPFTIGPDRSRTVAVTFDPPESGSRFATLHVMSDDPDEPQRNVWLTNTPMVADVSPSTVLADRTIVNVSVTDVQANVSQSVNVSWPLTRDDAVAIDSIAFTPERTENFTLNVTKSTQRLEGTPPFDPDDGTEDAAFVSMNSTIPDEDLRNVSVVFRVRKDQLAGNETGPEDVTLYTRQNGTWTELPTQLVDEGPTHYFYEARATGLADFATGIKQAKFQIDDAVVRVTEIRTGDDTEVLVRVTNVGGADGTYVVKLLSGDAVVDRRELSIAPNGTRQTVFVESFDDPGTYALYVNDRFAGNVTVSPGTTTNESASRGGATVGEPPDRTLSSARTLPAGSDPAGRPVVRPAVG
ncbi:MULTISPECIES: choice-of-anchor D domain-containing protein [Halorussus]|uniref:choice-of-anchor D domain-containing protein n=1 Tax=Halorussus TaxID=1070314 RepID=UPI0013B460BA|nr:MULTISPECIES: choice-of-anchor D domain-containing protein [Halorussus]NHN61607.1 choice-of-anchor D domain-containing protein [Halorussus sp. JP-T4]